MCGLIRNTERSVSSDPDAAGRRDPRPSSSTVENGDTHTRVGSIPRFWLQYSGPTSSVDAKSIP